MKSLGNNWKISTSGTFKKLLSVSVYDTDKR